MLDFRTVGVAEARVASMRVVDQLVGHDQRTRAHVVADAADRVDADDTLCAEAVQRPDIRPVIDPMRRNRVAGSMPREERDTLAAEFAERHRIRRRAVRCIERTLFHILQTGKIIQTSAADYGEFDIHCLLPSYFEPISKS